MPQADGGSRGSRRALKAWVRSPAWRMHQQWKRDGQMRRNDPMQRLSPASKRRGLVDPWINKRSGKNLQPSPAQVARGRRYGVGTKV